MAKLTLLEMVQDILSSMDSDDVNSISDTVESSQVAGFIKETYFSLITERDWPFLRSLTTLTAYSDVNNPTKMRIPTTVNKLLWVKYNKKDVTYLDPLEFKSMLDTRVETTGVVDANGYLLNQDPQYWTTYDDDVIWFDGYNSALDNTLQESKTSVYAVIIPAWSHVDSFVPLMPEKFFPTFLAEAKATCFINIKQQPNSKEEGKAKRGRSRMQNEAWRSNVGESKYNSAVNYGRKRNAGYGVSRKNKFAV